jgi:hypothetical protein
MSRWIFASRGDCYGKVERANAGRPSVERHHPEDSKDISEGGKEFSEVLRQVPGGVERKRGQGLVHLLKDRKLSGGTYKYYVSGIKFLYRTLSLPQLQIEA